MDECRYQKSESLLAMIEQHDPISVRIEQPAMPRRASRSRTAMQHDGRLASRIAAGLPVDAITVANFEHAMLVRFDSWIQLCHASLPAQLLSHPAAH